MTITAMTGFNNEVTASCEVTIEPADLVLTDDWSIIRNDPEYWTINDEHSITITTQPGEFYTGTDNAQNVILTPAEGDIYRHHEARLHSQWRLPDRGHHCLPGYGQYLWRIQAVSQRLWRQYLHGLCHEQRQLL